MIVRCPSCSSRSDILSLNDGNIGTLVDCATCGHEWVVGRDLAALSGPRPAQPEPADQTPTDPAAAALIEAARLARQEFQGRRQARRSRAAAWTALAAFALSPFAAAAVFPEQVVASVPASIRLYDWMGQEVNIYGLEIRQVDLQHLIVDGRKVIAVKGEIANASSSVRKIPWLRFGLRSADNAEVYHWTLDTEARPLQPGESTSFVTRLASPPEAARNVEIRFARADEIGSNVGP